MHIKSIAEVINEKFILILTSNSTEKNFINKLYTHKTNIEISKNINGKLGIIGDKVVLHLTGGLGISSENSIGRIAIQFLNNDEYPSPYLTILAGICWGNPMYTQIGDVLISNSILSCNLQNSDGLPTAPKTVNSIFCIGNIEKSEFNTHLNVTMLSQENRIENQVIRDNILRSYEPIHGGEMEGFSFLSSNSNWLIVKAVSDHGDSLNHATQQSVISNIAPSLYDCISTLKYDTITKRLEELISYLKGTSILFDHKDIEFNKIQIGLLKKYGSSIEQNISNYHSKNENFDRFTHTLNSFIFEISSNSFIHGKANSIKIEFFEKKIKIIDDGQPFDLINLDKEYNGGTIDFNNLMAMSDLVFYEYQRTNNYNIYTLALSDIICDIKETKIDCEISNEHLFKNWFNSDIVDYDESCSAYYIDARELILSSYLHLLLSYCCKILKNSEKLIFLKVKNEEHKIAFVKMATRLRFPDEDISKIIYIN